MTELINSDSFERIWRTAATEQMAKRFGGSGGGGRDDAGTTAATEGFQLPSRNMVGDYIASDEFHQAVCKGGSQGMSSMGGFMSNRGAPWSYMGDFVGSEKFQHGTCDMMSQGMIQFGQGMNGWFAARSEATIREDPMRAIDAFFRSEHYEQVKEQLERSYSDVSF